MVYILTIIIVNSYPDTEAHMTTVEDMRENLLNTLTYLVNNMLILMRLHEIFLCY